MNKPLAARHHGARRPAPPAEPSGSPPLPRADSRAGAALPRASTKAIAALAALLLATPSLAAKTPVNVDFETRAGTVGFPHRLHAARGCKSCHAGVPAKIPGFDKEKAHALCKGCHEDLGKGPMKCDGCHKR